MLVLPLRIWGYQFCFKGQLHPKPKLSMFCALSLRLKKKNKFYVTMTQSCCAHLFFSACLIQQNSNFIFRFFFFFACLIFFSSFLWSCLSKYTWKDTTDTIKHFSTFRLFQPSVLSCILFIQKTSISYSILNKVVTNSYLTKKKKNMLKNRI